WELAYILRKLGYLAARQGDLTLAMARAQEGLTLARELGDQSLIATTLCTLGEITEYRGDLMQATAWTQEGLALARKLGDKALVAVALQNLGYLALLEGDMTQAVARAQEGLMLARELGDKASIALTLCTLGEIASRLGDLAQATSWYHEGLPLAQEVENETLIGWYLIGLARVAAAERQPERAALLFGAAETRLDVKVKMNAIERADYERVVAGVRNQLSQETFAAVWAKGRNMTPEQVLDAQGSAMRGEMVSAMSQPSISTKGRPRYPAGLTAREVEVLHLVAQGLTDAQVAERLVITPRTVNFHLTSIYGKIGVSSRAAATRYAIEQKLA
ncbi:MAG: LuxR C-terminal-related transcriptional regulator, partial [Chloroflexota bacterium]|nr:LuxR C-terminal-related transcriptional regulator [Chloroflexota bacterium]